MLHFWLRSPLFEEAPPDGVPGGGGGAGADPKPGAFDPAAFKADLLTEIRKDLNGITKGLKNDIAKLAKPADPPVDPAVPPVDPSKPVDPEKNALLLEIKKLRQESSDRIKVLEDAKSVSEKKAEEMALDGELRDVLAEFEFITPEAQKTAMQILKPLVQRDGDGALIAGDLPLKKYVQTELPAKHAYLIKAKSVGGADARTGKSGGGGKWDIQETLKPENFSKLTPQQKTEFRQYVAKMA